MVKKKQKNRNDHPKKQVCILEICLITFQILLIAAKPVTTPKAQLFKVQSNRLLKENLLITTYRKDPFFEDK
jgi:hypothetical protein